MGAVERRVAQTAVHFVHRRGTLGAMNNAHSIQRIAVSEHVDATPPAEHHLLVRSWSLFRNRVFHCQQILRTNAGPLQPEYVGGYTGPEAGQHIDTFPIAEIE